MAMTPEERDAVRALIAALPRCEHVLSYPVKGPPVTCGKPATKYDDPWGDTNGSAEPREYRCDEHGVMKHYDDLDYAEPLRKLQAMLDPEESAPACVDRAVFKALEKDGVQFATFTNDGAGRRIAEVDMGPAGKATFLIGATDTTETLAAKVRAQLGHRLGVSAGIECPACCSRAEHEVITIGALDGSTTHRCKCGMTWATKGTPG